jgi:hypothetical protein
MNYRDEMAHRRLAQLRVEAMRRRNELRDFERSRSRRWLVHAAIAALVIAAVARFL